MPRLLVVTPHAPAPDLGHAGGVLLHHRLQALRRHAEVTVLAPRTPQNERVAAVSGAVLVEAEPPVRGRRLLLEATVGDLSGATPRIGRALRTDPALAALVGAQEAIEVHWGEQLPLVPVLRALAPSARIGVVLHDVVSQARRGRVDEPLVWWPERLAYRVGRRAVRHRELALLAQADLAVVLKQSDADGLRAAGLDLPVLLLTPWLERPEPAPGPAAVPVATFISALWREENAAAARWLVEQVWPQVRARVPGAELRLVGQGPPPWLVPRPEQGVVVTGFVDDLDAEYRRARVALAPLTTPTGLKVKVPQAMAYGLPVVARPPALAGLADAPADVLGASTDDPGAYADAVVRLLSAPGLAEQVGARASTWVRARYAPDQDVAAAIAAYAAPRASRAGRSS